MKTNPASTGFTASTDLIAVRDSVTSLTLSASNIIQEAAQSRGIVIQNTSIAVRDGSYINVRIYTPPKPGASGNPVYVAFHGGGFVLGGYV